MKSTIILTLAVLAVICTLCSASHHASQSEICNQLSSCSSCLSKNYCTWCIKKSICTKQACGNDNPIYPKRVRALLSGPSFCPRVVRPQKELTFPKGTEQVFVVRLTQIHLYMAFTNWKCKISLGEEEIIVSAVLRADEVHCSPVLLSNTSPKPVEGSATVLWDSNKTFDGSLLFKVSP